MNKIINILKQKYTLKQSIESVDGIVDPTFLRLSLGGVMDKFDSVLGEYKTDWSKLFLDVKKSKGILSTLIKGLFGTYGGELEYIMDLNTNEYSPKDVTMVFAGTPDKKQQKQLVKVFQQSLGSQYEVVLINGDETTNREAEELAKKTVSKAKREGKKVVFISKDMGSRSFSVPEIDTVILMFDRGSYATISQKISRVLTPGKTYDGEEKQNGYVISLSLDPNREEVNPIDEYIVYEAEKVGVNELSDGIKRVLNSINIFTNGEGVLYGLEIDKYVDRLINSSSLIRLGKSSSNPDNIMVSDELITLLTGIEVYKGEKGGEEKLSGIDSSLVKKFLEKEVKENKGSVNDEKEDKKLLSIREKIREHMENIVDNIVEISEINNCESDDIIECLDMIKEKGYDEEVVFEVDLDSDTVKKIILMGGVSHKLLNTIITSYNKEENSLLVK
jgi:superfamily II DNA or RNA helicase